MPTPPPVGLRRVTAEDSAAVLALNAAEVVKLSPMDATTLHELDSVADRFDVVEVDQTFGGFVITLAPGAGYDSPHYQWFSSRYGDHFYYLDRIVLAPSARRRGVGGVVYDAMEAAAAPYRRLTLEVNVEPPNPASMAFHQGRGYLEVGRLGDAQHLVSLMAKELGPPSEDDR